MTSSTSGHITPYPHKQRPHPVYSTMSSRVHGPDPLFGMGGPPLEPGKKPVTEPLSPGTRWTPVPDEYISKGRILLYCGRTVRALKNFDMALRIASAEDLLILSGEDGVVEVVAAIEGTPAESQA